MDKQNEPVRWSMEEKEDSYRNCLAMINRIENYIYTFDRCDLFSQKDMDDVASYLRDYSDHLANILLVKHMF